jgi:trehalose-6-phosphate synthase
MQADEKQMRMQRMRRQVRENNIYRWAGSLIGELCEVRLDTAEGGGNKFRAGASVG